MSPNIKIPKTPQIFNCEMCNYHTLNKKDYKKHEDTTKHKLRINPNDTYLKKPIPIYQCKCGKTYKHSSTLSNHKKNCNTNITSPQSASLPTDVIFFKNLVLEVVKTNVKLQKQNHDFQKQILELYKTTNTSIMNNSCDK